MRFEPGQTYIDNDEERIVVLLSVADPQERSMRVDVWWNVLVLELSDRSVTFGGSPFGLTSEPWLRLGHRRLL